MRSWSRQNVLGLAIALALSWGGPTAAIAETLKVGVLENPGFCMVDQNGHLSGFHVDLSREICSELKAQCTFVLMSLDEMLANLAKGTSVDMAVAGLTRTPERERKFLFSDRIQRDSASFMARANTIDEVTPAALAGKRIAVAKESVEAQYLKQQFGATATIVEYADVNEIYDAVAKGTVDLGFDISPSVMHFLLSEAGRGLELVGDPITEDTENSGGAIGLPFGREALRERVNAALRTLLMNGRYDAINSRYFPVRLY